MNEIKLMVFFGRGDAQDDVVLVDWQVFGLEGDEEEVVALDVFGVLAVHQELPAGARGLRVWSRASGGDEGEWRELTPEEAIRFARTGLAWGQAS